MFTISVLMTAVTAVAAGDGKKFDPPQGPTVEARIMLTDVLAKIDNSGLESSAQIRLLSSAISEAVKRLQPHSPVADSLSGALVDSSQQASDTRLARLKQVVSDVLADLQFEPIAEAGLPKGFPTYTPVGTIEVKEYPEYRMAAGPGFWTLFMHIQSNGIAMTAPVEMTYEASGAGEVKEAGMAFLYGDQSIGQPGRSGKVEVIDNQRQTVVSVGIRGRRTAAVLSDARHRLQQWIESQEKYRLSGSMRVMGYNSPSVAADKQYFEVQIPIETDSHQ